MAAGGVSLEAVGVEVRFGGITALADVSLNVPSGSLVGLIGPNGAGKSTLFDVLSGFLRPHRGMVRLGNRDVTNLSVQARSRLGLARSFQQPALFSGMTVRDHLVLADRLRFARRRIWSDFLTGRGFRRPDAAEAERVAATVELLGLSGVADMLPGSLSLGTCRLVEVGRAVAMSPGVLLLDEPAAGLDPVETVNLADALARAIGSNVGAVLLVDHDLEFVLSICDYIYVLDFGKKIAEGPPGVIRQSQEVTRAYIGEMRKK
jgi:ABC-type branched-subunit amino acid transport system ATPase component